MKTAAIRLATLGLAVAGSAIAHERISDAYYLKANRCRGLAAGLGERHREPRLPDQDRGP